MKILQVHKYLYRKAGAEAYVLDLAELLIKNGHEVKLWSAGENYDFSKREGLVKDLKKFGHMVWSRDAAKKFDAVLKEFKPDVIHLHNIYHHISPSILSVARKYKVPVVMSVHDYKLINPNYTLYDHGQICERQGLSAIAHRCVKNSAFATMACVLEGKIMDYYKKDIAQFIVPTEFVKGKLIKGGMGGKKIEVVKLLVSQKSKIKSQKLGDYILFAGRLVEEKGIYLLLEIAKQLPDIQFKIAGTGPELSRITYHISRNTMRNVELLGFVQKEKLQKLIVEARLVMVPSLWYDPSPYAVLEAMAMGKAVVASRIGGIADLIEDKATGFLLEKEQWVDAIKKLYYDETLLKRVGQAAGEYIKREHNAEEHYERLIQVYEGVLKNYSN